MVEPNGVPNASSSGIGSLCRAENSNRGEIVFDPEHGRKAENSSYFDKQRSGYERVENFSFVGEGQGAYDKRKVTVYTGWRVRKCCLAVLFLIGFLILILMLSVGGGSTKSAGDPASEEARQQLKRKSMGSVGGSDSQEVNAQLNPGTIAARNKGIAVNSNMEPFDCDQGLSDWKQNWPIPKKEWCCQHYQKGCPEMTSLPFDCIAGQENSQAWTALKQAFCCQHFGKGCPSSNSPPELPYDCDKEYDGPKSTMHWDDGKKAWCCLHKKRACPTLQLKSPPPNGGLARPVVAPVPQVQPSAPPNMLPPTAPPPSVPVAPGAPTPSVLVTPGAPLPSVPIAPKAPAPSVPVALETPPPSVPVAPEVPPSSVPVAPEAPLPSVPVAPTTSPPSVSVTPAMPAPTAAPVPAAAPLNPAATPVQYRGCDTACSFEGFTSSCKGHIQWATNKWFTGRTDGCMQSYKKVMQSCPMCSRVCDFEETKCVVPTPYVPTRINQPVPTPTTKPYDCNAGFASWQAGWSVPKKVWCCAQQQRGCPESTTSRSYDCEAAYSNWKTSWSESKKVWCCQHRSRGCPEAIHLHG